jgi:hypothetical protein
MFEAHFHWTSCMYTPSPNSLPLALSMSSSSIYSDNDMGLSQPMESSRYVLSQVNFLPSFPLTTVKLQWFASIHWWKTNQADYSGSDSHQCQTNPEWMGLSQPAESSRYVLLLSIFPPHFSLTTVELQQFASIHWQKTDKAYLPIMESFSFNSDLCSQTAGQAFLQREWHCVQPLGDHE